MEDENIEKEIFNTRKRMFSQKFKIKDDNMSKHDLKSLISQLDINDITKKDFDFLFSSLDKNNDGKVSIDDFLTSISDRKITHEKIKNFLNKVNDKLLTNSEIMMLKIKNLKKRATFANDKESIDDLNWILLKLTEGDFYDPVMENVISNTNDKNEKDFILEYSHLKKNLNIENDIKQISELKRNSLNLSKKISLLNDELSASIISNNSYAQRNSSGSISSTRLSEINFENLEEFANFLENINKFDFDPFRFDEITKNGCLYYFTFELFCVYDFFSFIDELVFKEFITQIQKGYSRNNAYHNDIHAVDVLQSCFAIIDNGNLAKKINLTDIDLLSIFLSAICHDFKHPGYNNNFQINLRTDIAINYNDQSVLENFHVAESFKVILDPACNILAKITNEEFRQIRRRMISCILATDMAYHYKHISALKGKLETFEISNGKNIEKLILADSSSKNNENQQLILDNCIHLCDISNPAKKANIYDKWVDLVFQEFFNQGDKEKVANVPVSLLCDRSTTNITKAQIGFINFIVKPYFDCFANLLPEIQPYMDNLSNNLKRYELKDKEQALIEKK